MPNKDRFTLFGFCFPGAKILQSPVYNETILSIPQCAITDDILAHEFSELAKEQMLTGSDGEVCYVPGHEEEDHHHDDEDDHDDHDEDSHHDDMDHGSGSGSGAKGEYKFVWIEKTSCYGSVQK